MIQILAHSGQSKIMETFSRSAFAKRLLDQRVKQVMHTELFQGCEIICMVL